MCHSRPTETRHPDDCPVYMALAGVIDRFQLSIKFSMYRTTRPLPNRRPVRHTFYCWLSLSHAIINMQQLPEHGVQPVGRSAGPNWVDRAAAYPGCLIGGRWQYTEPSPGNIQITLRRAIGRQARPLRVASMSNRHLWPCLYWRHGPPTTNCVTFWEIVNIAGKCTVIRSPDVCRKYDLRILLLFFCWL